MEFFKDDPGIIAAALAPEAVYDPLPPAGTTAGALARTWNRIGGLARRLAERTGIETEAVLAVWLVESGGHAFVADQPVLRLECHKLFDVWGRRHGRLFDRHFRFGGRAGVPGRRWTRHAMRKVAGAAWRSFHGRQSAEYEAHALATTIAGLEASCLASSFGGPQILGSNHAALGYDSAAALFGAFKASERAQVCGFFDFCRSQRLLDPLVARRWRDFAAGYNGAGQAKAYAGLIDKAWTAAKALGDPTGKPVAPHLPAADPPLPPPAVAPVATEVPVGTAATYAPLIPSTGDDAADFTGFVERLGLKHFSAAELLVMGHQHANPGSPAFGLNRRPPRALWANIAPTVLVLDRLRDRLGVPIVTLSAYRSPAYNRCIAGAKASQHTQFRAVDFLCRGASRPADWARVLRRMRADGLFKGGIGTYASFVHLDTRGHDADW